MRRRLWMLLSIVAVMTASLAVATGSLAARPAPTGAYPDLRAVVPQKLQLANQQQRDIETRMAALAAMIEPVMIIFMGALVLAIVLAVLLPIFELNQLVK